MTTLRLAIDLLAAGQQVVVFPEGTHSAPAIEPIKLRPGAGAAGTTRPDDAGFPCP